MKVIHLIKVLLAIASLVALWIGGALTFTPLDFHAASQIVFESPSASLLSELRSPGGVLVIAGFLMFLGVFQKKMIRLSLTVSTMVYLGYALGRLVSWALDDKPNQSLLIALAIELLLGTLSALVLLKNKPLT
ncbi:DUF4345 domain-containing protein [Aquimarina spongiae]|uniref:DUF4345 domain-containing protein n=1 Tax=Aquimarina spongiae TaxID=570521 RepID=A0A1M6CIT4_9FLAO|nr:DUF4345 domain-containing protein [Aquimarina spongiae]SHI60942.1 protein of unknown function [Aquimarina spongiae]